VNIANELLFADGTGTGTPTVGGGVLAWYAHLYRAWRADIRLKLVFETIPADPSLPAPRVFGWVSHAQPSWGTTDIGSSLGATSASAMLGIYGGEAPFPQPSQMHSHNFIISDAIPEIVEVEIPYSRLSQFSLPPSYSGDLTQDPYGAGFLTISLFNSSTTTINAIMRVYASLGDAGRFGIPTFLPPLTIIPDQFPDQWQRPTRAIKMLVESPPESEEEYVEIPKPAPLKKYKVVGSQQPKFHF